MNRTTCRCYPFKAGDLLGLSATAAEFLDFINDEDLELTLEYRQYNLPVTGS